jgi:hypothetical protein
VRKWQVKLRIKLRLTKELNPHGLKNPTDNFQKTQWDSSIRGRKEFAEFVKKLALKISVKPYQRFEYPAIIILPQ